MSSGHPEHGFFKNFQDDDIQKVFPLRRSEIKDEKWVWYAKIGKDIVGDENSSIRKYEELPCILQQSKKSCGNVCLQMIAIQCGFNIESHDEYTTVEMLEKIMLKFHYSFPPRKHMRYSWELLKSSKKPAIVSSSGIGKGHFFIVDYADDNFVIIRDPYHGWMIQVSSYTFLKEHEVPYRGIDNIISFKI